MSQASTMDIRSMIQRSRLGLSAPVFDSQQHQADLDVRELAQRIPDNVVNQQLIIAQQNGQSISAEQARMQIAEMQLFPNGRVRAGGQEITADMLTQIARIPQTFGEGISQAVQGTGGAIGLAAEALGAQGFSDEMNVAMDDMARQQQVRRTDDAARGEARGALDQASTMAGFIAPQIATAAIPGPGAAGTMAGRLGVGAAATGGTKMPVAVMVTQAIGAKDDEIRRERAARMAEDGFGSRALGALGAGAIEYVTEKLGLGFAGNVAGPKLTKIGQELVGGKADEAMRILGETVGVSLANMPEEAAAELLNNISDRVTYDPERDAFEGVGEAAVSGAAMGPLFGGSLAAGRRLQRSSDQMQQQVAADEGGFSVDSIPAMIARARQRAEAESAQQTEVSQADDGGPGDRRGDTQGQGGTAAVQTSLPDDVNTAGSQPVPGRGGRNAGGGTEVPNADDGGQHTVQQEGIGAERGSPEARPGADGSGTVGVPEGDREGRAGVRPDTQEQRLPEGLSPGKVVRVPSPSRPDTTTLGRVTGADADGNVTVRTGEGDSLAVAPEDVKRKDGTPYVEKPDPLADPEADEQMTKWIEQGIVGMDDTQAQPWTTRRVDQETGKDIITAHRSAPDAYEFIRERQEQGDVFQPVKGAQGRTEGAQGRTEANKRPTPERKSGLFGQQVTDANTGSQNDFGFGSESELERETRTARPEIVDDKDQQTIDSALNKRNEPAQMPPQIGTKKGVVDYLKASGETSTELLEEMVADEEHFLIRVPISKIPFVYSETAPSQDDSKVVALSKRKPDELPPAVLGANLDIIDGGHRIAAARKRGEDAAWAYVPASQAKRMFGVEHAEGAFPDGRRDWDIDPAEASPEGMREARKLFKSLGGELAKTWATGEFTDFGELNTKRDKDRNPGAQQFIDTLIEGNVPDGWTLYENKNPTLPNMTTPDWTLVHDTQDVAIEAFAIHDSPVVRVHQINKWDAPKLTPYEAKGFASANEGIADDIPLEAAVRAHQGTSHTPETRGENEIKGYVSTVESFRKTLEGIAKSDEQRALIDTEVRRFRRGLKQKKLAELDARSRLLSVMITGPSGFNQRRNEKAGETHGKRLDELLSFIKRAEKSARKRVAGALPADMANEQDLEDARKMARRGAMNILDIRLGKSTGSLDLFKANLAQKLGTLAKNGQVKQVEAALEEIREVEKAGGKKLFTDRHSIWKLPEVAGRVVDRKQERVEGGSDTIAEYEDGIQLIRNHEADRVQILFDGKPPAAVRTDLKSANWRWSPKNGVWQRKLTVNAEASAKQILSKHYELVSESETPSTKQQAPRPAEKPKPKGDPAKAKKLRMLADKAQEQADKKMQSSYVTGANTARQASIGDSVRNDAERLESVARALRGLADMHEDGSIPDFAKGIDSKTLVDQLLGEPKLREPGIHRGKIRGALNKMKGKKGAPEMRQVWEHLSRDSGSDYFFNFGTDPASIRNWIKKAQALKKASGEKYFEIWGGPQWTRADKAGLLKTEDYDAARNLVLEMGKRGGNKVSKAQQLERKLIGQKGIGIDYFPTPTKLARTLVEEAGIKEGDRVLEPSAGNGHIADAIKETGADVDVVEMSPTLREILDAKGHNVVGQDFMDYRPGPIYDAIVMNPPFSNSLDADHVQHAYTMLKPGGTLKAIMGEGVFFRDNKRDNSFREWVEEVGAESEKLPEGTFKQAQRGLPTTGVSSRVLTVTKPVESKQEQADEGQEARGQGDRDDGGRGAADVANEPVQGPEVRSQAQQGSTVARKPQTGEWTKQDVVDRALEAINRISPVDIADDVVFAFRGPLPGEIKDQLEGKKYLLPLFKSNVDKAGLSGEDTLADLGAEEMIRQADMLIRERSSGLDDRLDSLVESGDPEIQLYHFLRFTLLEKTPRVSVVDNPSDTLETGTEFKLRDTRFRVEDDGDFGKIAVQLDDAGQPVADPYIFALPALKTLPVDVGTVRDPEARTRAKERVRRLSEQSPKGFAALSKRLGLSPTGEIGRDVEAVLSEVEPGTFEEFIGSLQPFEAMGATSDPNLKLTDAGSVVRATPTAKEFRSERERKRAADEYTFANPDTEARWKASQGRPTKGPLDHFKETVAHMEEAFVRGTQRGSIPQLDRRGFGEARAVVNRLRGVWENAANDAIEALKQITSPLDDAAYDVFTRYVYIQDFYETAQEDKALPLGFTKESIKAEKQRVERVVETQFPEVKTAYEVRQRAWKLIKDVLLERAGKLSDSYRDTLAQRYQREHYMHHEILEKIAEGNLLDKKGSSAQIGKKRSYDKARKGSKLDINTAYVEAEFKVMASMLADAHSMEQLARIQKKYDVYDKVRQKAKDLEADWRDHVPDGYEIFYVRPGRVFFQASGLPEAVANMLLENDALELNITGDDLTQFLAVGGNYKPWIIPNEVAEAMREYKPAANRADWARWPRKALSVWKSTMLGLNPIGAANFIKYRFRNQSEFEKMLTINPSATRQMRTAMKHLRMYLKGDPAAPREIREWVRRGGLRTMQRHVELGEAVDMKVLDSITISQDVRGKKPFKISGIPARMWEGYGNRIGKINDLLEGWYRYATYLDYLDQMQNGGRSGKAPRNFGSSVPEEIMGITDVRDRAFKLADDIFVPYDDISALGDTLRRYYVPFWAFQEGNFRAYWQASKNIASNPQVSGREGEKIIRDLRKRNIIRGAVPVASHTVRSVGRLFILYKAAQLAVFGWNQMIMAMLDDDELVKDLPDQAKRSVTIVFGRDEQGRVLYFNRLGTSGDFLDWFGLEAVPHDIADLLNGKRTMQEIAVDMARSGPNKLAQGLGPHITLPIELATDAKFFPDVFKPGRVRDPWDHIAQALDLSGLYRRATGRPGRSVGDGARNVFLYSSDPGSAAYSRVMDEVNRFRTREGLGAGFHKSKKGQALYWFRTALRYKDQKAAVRWATEYAILGGTPDGMKQSLRRLHPLGGLSSENRAKFISTLRQEDIDDIEEATLYYKATILGGENDMMKDVMREVGENMRELRKNSE